MIKLKDILSEGYAWERKPGGKLPTLADVKKIHEESLNELSDEEIDARWNTPDQMTQRVYNTHYKSGAKSKRAVAAKDWDISKIAKKNPDYADAQRREISRFYQEKLAAAEADRQQLMFDMEQEAEPEGGPIADFYGEQLEFIDKQIETIRNRMSV